MSFRFGFAIDISLFHQIGSDKSNGYQAWETWDRKYQTEDDLRTLFEQIHQEAENTYNIFYGF